LPFSSTRNPFCGCRSQPSKTRLFWQMGTFFGFPLLFSLSKLGPRGFSSLVLVYLCIVLCAPVCFWATFSCVVGCLPSKALFVSPWVGLSFQRSFFQRADSFLMNPVRCVEVVVYPFLLVRGTGFFFFCQNPPLGTSFAFGWVEMAVWLFPSWVARGPAPPVTKFHFDFPLSSFFLSDRS